MNRYEGIVEVQALSPGRVNTWLEGGYQLLSIEVTNSSGRHPVESSGANAGGWYVRRNVRFVVGRTADVEAIPWEQPNAERGKLVAVDDADTTPVT